jgi:hypothetical protein
MPNYKTNTNFRLDSIHAELHAIMEQAHQEGYDRAMAEVKARFEGTFPGLTGQTFRKKG